MTVGNPLTPNFSAKSRLIVASTAAILPSAPSSLRMVATSSYAGFIALQCPHPTTTAWQYNNALAFRRSNLGYEIGRSYGYSTSHTHNYQPIRAQRFIGPNLYTELTQNPPHNYHLQETIIYIPYTTMYHVSQRYLQYDPCVDRFIQDRV